MNYSNIKLIYDYYFENNTNLYNYLPLVDALITDYSSVYFDFLLADKPIGLAIPDLELYKEIVNQPYNYEETVIGEKILNYNELVNFITNVIEEKDIMKEERNKAKLVYHKFIDGNSSSRVIEILKKQVGRGVE